MSIYKGNQLLSGIATNTISNAHSLFDFIWSDHIKNEMSWLRADTFSWQSGAVYVAAYNHLVADYNNIATISAIALDSETSGIPAGSLFYRYSGGDTTHTVSSRQLYAWKNGIVIVYTYSETPLEDIAITSPSDTGSDLLVDDFISGKQSYSETIGSYTITYYLAADGHKICTPDQETTLANIYNESGVAWYYILDTTNQRFKLPRTKYGFVGLRDTVGKYVLESLPNIKASGPVTILSDQVTFGGAFYKEWSAQTGNPASGSYRSGLGFDASLSSSTYQDNAPVQQRATQMYLYFYVGQFSQSATEQTAGLNAELFNGKVDLNAANLSTQGKSLISSLGMPSGRYDDLTLGSSGTEYTAPANGYFCLMKNSNAGGQNIALNNNTNPGLSSFATNSATTQALRCFIPVHKNDIMSVGYTAGGAVQWFRFYYAEGEENV